MFHFFKTTLIPVSGLHGHFTVNRTDCANGKRDSGTKFTSPAFADHLPKRWTDWFAHVDGKQPLSYLKKYLRPLANNLREDHG